MTAMLAFLNGMTTMGFVVAAMFFLRFWRRTKDPLFLTFAGAFLLLALNQVLIGLSVVPSEDRSLLYLPRLAAFALLIVAIVWKNLARTSAKGS
jgi:hypothetical protein